MDYYFKSEHRSPPYYRYTWTQRLALQDSVFWRLACSYTEGVPAVWFVQHRPWGGSQTTKYRLPKNWCVI